jgi:hypothetical protein
MLRGVALVISDVSEELSASFLSSGEARDYQRAISREPTIFRLVA